MKLKELLFIYFLIFIAHTTYKQNGTAITLITIQLLTTVYYLTIRLRTRVFYEGIVNEAEPSWLSLVENESE